MGRKGFEAAYLRLSPLELERRAALSLEVLKDCTVCPWRCRVDRTSGVTGACGVGRFSIVASVGAHFGEEPPLVGTRGSGTVFFAGCNLQCAYCQNYDISHLRHGCTETAEAMATDMIRLQEAGCHNVNFVTPTHVVPQILEALQLAVGRGLRVPLVYNTGGYDTVETLKTLDGVIDIYMPDMKYADEAAASKYSGVPDYPEVNRRALLEMHRQVGALSVDDDGVATRGVLIRHLILPEALAGSRQILEFIAVRLGKQSYVNLMAQYHPSYKAREHAALSRRITREEYVETIEYARSLRLSRGFPETG